MRVICPHCIQINNIPKKASYNKANCGKCKKSLLDYSPLELTDENFDKVIDNTDIPVIINIWAPWATHTGRHHFIETATKYPLKALFTYVNTDKSKQTTERLGICCVPSLRIFKDSIEVHREDDGRFPLIALVEKFIS